MVGLRRAVWMSTETVDRRAVLYGNQDNLMIVLKTDLGPSNLDPL